MKLTLKNQIMMTKIKKVNSYKININNKRVRLKIYPIKILEKIKIVMINSKTQMTKMNFKMTKKMIYCIKNLLKELIKI